MRKRKDIQVVRQGDRVVLTVASSWPHMAIRNFLHPLEARALGEALISESSEAPLSLISKV